MEKLCDEQHLLNDIYIECEPYYQTRTRVSIENLPIEISDKKVKDLLTDYTTVIGKTYYSGIRSRNKYFTTRTQVFKIINLIIWTGITNQQAEMIDLT